MKKENNNKIAEKIISKIEKKELRMKPKIYFVFKLILFSLVFLIVFLLVLYFASFVIFFFRLSDILFFSDMGFHGIKILLQNLPWYIIILIISLIFLIELLGKNIAQIYRKPLIYSFVLIIILISFLSVLIEKSSLHEKLLFFSQKEDIPVAGRMYKSLENIDFENVYTGKILEIKDRELLVEIDEKVLTLILESKGRRQMYILERLVIGERIIIIGEIKDDQITAINIKKANGKRFNEI